MAPIWIWSFIVVLNTLMSLEAAERNRSRYESSYIIDCIRNMVPTEVYAECCLREHNCSATREQSYALDCISRLMMANSTWLSESSRDMSSSVRTDDSSYIRSRNFKEIGEAVAELCRRQPRTRLQTCIRNDLVNRCRDGLLQDRITRQPTRFYGRMTDYGRGGDYDRYDRYGYGDRLRGPYRRHQGGVLVRGPTEYIAEPWSRDSFEEEEEKELEEEEEEERYPESYESRYIK